jgi:AcrR family transcriptional regulator
MYPKEAQALAAPAPGRRGAGKARRAPGRPPGAVREATRARIVEAACQCFAQRGYAHTSNRDIAERAGLTTGALYHYFGSKAELFAAVHRHVQSVLLAAYRRAFEEERTCVAQLCAGLEAALALSRVQPALVQFAAVAALEIQRHPELSASVATDTQDIRGFFRHLLAAGRRRGEIARTVDREAVVNVVVSALFGLAWLRGQLERQADYEAAIRAFQRLLQGALFAA